MLKSVARKAMPFLKALVKVGKNMAIRGVNEAFGKPCNTFMVDFVCGVTDEGVDALQHLLKDKLTPAERREAVEEIVNLPPAELDQAVAEAVAEEAPEAPAEIKQGLQALARQVQNNAKDLAAPPDARGHSGLPAALRFEAKEELQALLQPRAGGLRAGELVNNRFRIVHTLDKGGMGLVYLAWDGLLDGQVALKTVRPDSSDFAGWRKRFLDEGRLTKKLTHPHIVRVHDVIVDEARGLYALAMEYLNGRTLAAWLAERLRSNKPVTLDEFRVIADALCGALIYAHERPGGAIIHRDVKPSNVMLSDDLADIKLLDFGLAKVCGEPDVQMSQAGVGTAYYMAPEQLHGGAAVTPRSDLYALGVVFYEVLAGRVPVASSRPVPLSKRRPDLPKALSDAIETAMCEEPEERPASVRAFYAALREAMLARDSHLAPPNAGIPAREPPPREGIPAKRGDEKGFSPQQSYFSHNPTETPSLEPPLESVRWLLKIGAYDSARSTLARVLMRNPLSAEALALSAIAVFNGRPPQAATLRTARKALEYAAASVQIAPRVGWYALVCAAIKHYHFAHHHMRVEPPSVRELLRQARDCGYTDDEWMELSGLLRVDGRMLLAEFA